MIPVAEAQALVLDNIDPLPAETIDFAEACGRIRTQGSPTFRIERVVE